MDLEKNILDDDIDVAYRSDMSSNIDFHFHDVYEIYHSISGDKHIMINDQLYSVSPNDLFVMNNYDVHKITAAKDVPNERYVITFNPDVILPDCTPATNLLQCFHQDNHPKLQRIRLKKDEHVFLTGLYQKYIRLGNGYGRDILRKSVLLEILVHINHLFLLRQNEAKNRTAEPSMDAHYEASIAPLLRYIQEHLTDTLTLDKLAQYMTMDKHHMCKRFKDYTGTTIMTYIIARRISLAKNLLQQDLTVTEVCHAAGFKDYAHFIRTFTKLVGVSPGRYARKRLV